MPGKADVRAFFTEAGIEVGHRFCAFFLKHQFMAFETKGGQYARKEIKRIATIGRDAFTPDQMLRQANRIEREHDV